MQSFEMAADDQQQVVVVVGDAAGRSTQRSHAFCATVTASGCKVTSVATPSQASAPACATGTVETRMLRLGPITSSDAKVYSASDSHILGEGSGIQLETGLNRRVAPRWTVAPPDELAHGPNPEASRMRD